jgi:hypothetical protein
MSDKLQFVASFDKLKLVGHQTMQQAIYNRSVALLIILLTLPVLVAAQTVREKLQQQTNYRPRTTAPDEQLIEVARRFKIPMAIEWLDEKPATDQLAGLKFDKGSVLDLIKAIVDRAPQENLIVEDRIVRVFPPSAFNSRLNFLNLRLEDYCVRDECVYGADFEVRLGIDEMLYPEKFKYGYNGGYGGGEETLWINAINICVDNRTIRELLTEIAAQSGKAGWMAHLKPEELKGKQPFWKGLPLNEHGTSPITGHWLFFDLVEHER